MRPVGLALFLLLAAAPFGRPAQAEDSEHGARVASLVEGLEALALWCHKGKLFRARNETYEALLHFRPNHAKARSWLKYKRDKGGAWTRSARYKHPRNLKPGGDALDARRAEVGDAFAVPVLADLAPGRTKVPADERARRIRQVVLVAPHRGDARRAHGEIRTAEGTWVLKETLQSRIRRPALRQAAARALRSAPPPASVRPTTRDLAIGLGWKAILSGADIRMLGMVPAKELKRAHATAVACSSFYRDLYGIQAPAIPGLTIYVIENDEQHAAILKKHPAATERFRSFAANLASAWIPKATSFYVQGSTADARREWCARQPTGSLLGRGLGIRARHGWAFEGFGLYASYLLAGRRQTFFVRRTVYAEKRDRKGDLWDKLKIDGTDWRAHARTLLAGPNAPELRLLLGKEINTMNTEDMLVASMLAAFLVEGRPKQVVALLKSLGGGTRAPEAIRDTLALDVEGLELRLRRWLDETANDEADR